MVGGVALLEIVFQVRRALMALSLPRMIRPPGPSLLLLATWFAIPAIGIYFALPRGDTKTPDDLGRNPSYRWRPTETKVQVPSLRGARTILWIWLGLNGLLLAWAFVVVGIFALAGIAYGLGGGVVR